ncbi:hypothetical protein AVEN_35490-1 [Araneus ventricosus]|uniref:Histone H2A/H2B/H3 domain-containing protein n=1 Tax=Araneus ventricosus TaxID=182803 RepID=A0A4Y2IU39_ARAVE|nr:hypothetical protein AVEN_35490-1 [Araneus ventricosus]
MQKNIVSKSLSSSGKSRKRSTTEKINFRKYILRLNKSLKLKQKLSGRFLGEMDDFMCHILEMFEDNLTNLAASTYRKTLTVSQLENATRLSLPMKLDEFAIDYGRNAVSRSLRNIN